jgi:hypothetical protein
VAGVLLRVPYQQMLCSLRPPAARTRRLEELTTRATRLVCRTVPGYGEPTVHCAGSWPRRLGGHDRYAATGSLTMSVLTGKSQSVPAAPRALSCQYVRLEFAVDECSPSSRLGVKAMGAWASRWQRCEGWSGREEVCTCRKDGQERGDSRCGRKALGET